jgi:hypothetical protein
MTSPTPANPTPANPAPAFPTPAFPTPANQGTTPASAPVQLRLLAGGRDLAADVERDWVLDERTRRLGRYGVLQLRATLRQHRPVQPLDSAVA